MRRRGTSHRYEWPGGRGQRPGHDSQEAVGAGDARNRPLCDESTATHTLQRIPGYSSGTVCAGGTAGTGSSGSRRPPKASSGTTGAAGLTAAILR